MHAEGSPVEVGDLLAGKYRVERVLGVGGMGVVVAATHVELGQRVALKFLLPQALVHAEAAERFLREARAAVKIDSEHVARVIDVGRLESGAPYMVMEYLEGQDLSDHTKGAELPISDAVDFVLQACAAMAVAHTGGIVHRDLKPANLFLSRRPDGSPLVKVLDFGISKMTELDAGKAALTRTSAVMGSPLYMSPEQMRSSRNVDARTDIWSLGAILYELVSGVPPFNGETLGEVFAGVMTAEPASLRGLRPDVPARLEAAVLRALEKDPARRFAHVGELAAAIAEFAPERSRHVLDRVSGVVGRAGLTSPAMSHPGQAAPPVNAATSTSWEDAGAASAPRKRTPFVAGVLAVVVVAAVVVTVVVRGSGAPAVSSESPQPAVAAPPKAVEAQPPSPQPKATEEPAAPSRGAIEVVPVANPAPAPALPAAAATPLPGGHSPRQPARRAADQPAPAASPKASPASAPSPAPAPAAQTAPKKNPLSIGFK